MPNSMHTTSSLNMANDPQNGEGRFCAFAPWRGKRFAPRWWTILPLLALTALFLHLGQWQQGKAERKQAAQARVDTLAQRPAINLPDHLIASPADIDALRFAPVTVTGRFETDRTFFVDNQVNQERAGLHVITPLRIGDSKVRVLVNRGWIPAPAHHQDIPAIDTPEGEVQINAMAVLPPERFFTLGKEAAISPLLPQWPRLWQNLDLNRFRNAVSYPVQPLVLQLDPTSVGGFQRDWPRPDERWEKHWSYALQWYGFAISAWLIWFALSWRKT